MGSCLHRTAQKQNLRVFLACNFFKIGNNFLKMPFHVYILRKVRLNEESRATKMLYPASSPLRKYFHRPSCGVVSGSTCCITLFVINYEPKLRLTKHTTS